MVDSDEIAQRIKEGPNWRFLLRPEPFSESRMPLEEILPTVGRATVRFRGWDFPHLNPRELPGYHTNYVTSSDEFMGHPEYWRAYMSGQFLYLSGVREATEPGWKEKLAHSARNRVVVPTEAFDWSQVPGFIDVVNLVYTVTEFFEFAARYIQAMPDVDAVGIRVGLHNIQGFVLTVDDPRRALWQYCAASNPSLENTWELPLPRLVSSTDELALEAMRWILVRFGWTQPNMEAIKRDMDALTQRSR